jgi:parallel beta-helix repeat protein
MSTLRTNEIKDLAGNTLIKQGEVLATTVNTVADLASAEHKAGSIQLLGFHTKGDGGGGVFFWDATKDKSEHNGGTIIDPDKAGLVANWASTQALYFTPEVTGQGCWVREYSGAVNVKWFGAIGDGTADDTVAIQKAISIRGIIHLPRAVFRVAGLEISSLDDFELSGEAELRLLDNANTPVIKLVNCTNFTIEGLSFNGNKDNQTYDGNRNNFAGVSIIGTSTFNYKVVGNRVHNNLAGASILVITHGSSAATNDKGYIANNWIYNAGTALILSDGMFINSSYTTIENNHITNVSDYGIAADYAEKLTIKNNKIINSLVGIGVLGADDWVVEGNVVDTSGIGVAVTLSGNSAIEPYLSRKVLITNNRLLNIVKAPSGTPNGDAIFIDPSAEQIQIIGNYIETAFRGIGCNAPNVVVSLNYIKDVTIVHLFCSGAGSVVTNNTLEGSGAGLYVASYRDKVVEHGSIKDTTLITSFIGGWSNYYTSDTLQQAGYYRKNGKVHLNGVVKGGTTSLGQPLFQLPTGYRPSSTLAFTSPNLDGTTNTFVVDSNGYLVYVTGTGVSACLQNISFDLA